jgi:hypothetical protein
MSDWQPGDLALCVKVSPWRGARHGKVQSGQDLLPRPGRIYRVEGVNRDAGRTYLYLEGFERVSADGLRWQFRACCFIKVTPPEADEYDQETLELSNLSPVTVEG